VAALALTVPFATPALPRRTFLLAPLLACLPDLDVLAFRFGIPYGHPLGHRGLTHSLLFAILVAMLLVLVGYSRESRQASGLRLFVLFALVAASHGLLDALTNGGRGVGFFVPFWNERFFFPFRPIVVSPIAVNAFFTDWGWRVLKSEFIWVWIPSAVVAGSAWLWTRLSGAVGPAAPHR
jgi:inner membrane protein